jgi:hypothetical protein
MDNHIPHSLNKIFTNEECDYVINYIEENGTPFSYKLEYKSWECKRIYDSEFKLWVLNKFTDLKFWFDYSTFNVKNWNVSLTKYYDNKYLDLHLDSTSQYTTIIPLTDEYEDGRFVLSKNSKSTLEDAEFKIQLEKGQGLTFEGKTTYHGVMPVYKGIRYSLNVWMTDTDFTYPMIKVNKSLL